MDEEYEDEYISSEGDMDSDFDETNTSSVIHSLQLIAYLVLITLICLWFLIIVVNERQNIWHVWV